MQPIDRFISALEARDCRPRRKSGGRGIARCPNTAGHSHGDRAPSLTFDEGTDGRVLFDCKVGCDRARVVEALGLEWTDLFEDGGGNGDAPRGTKPRTRAAAPGSDPGASRTPPNSKLPSEDDLAVYREDLLNDEAMVAGLAKLRGWTPDALRKLGVGVVNADDVAKLGHRNDGLRRLLLPIRDAHGTLVNVELYAPRPETRGRAPKVLALTGCPRDMFPAPETFDGGRLFLVEGGGDAISAASIDLPASGIPGVGKWDDAWTERLKRFDEIVVCLDCDTPGRKKADDVGVALLKAGLTVRNVDLDPTRNDGYDLGDLLREARTDVDRKAARSFLLDMAGRSRKREPFKLRPVSGRDFMKRIPPANPADDFLGPFFRRGQRVVIGGHTGHGKSTLVLQAIAAAAYGLPFLKWVGRGNVKCLVIDLEQGERSLGKRLVETGIADRNGNVQIVNIPEGLELDRKLEQRAAVEDTLSSGSWDIVLLDPAYQLVAEEPTEDAQAQALVRMLDGWRSRFGFCLVIPMHCRKAAQQGGRLTISDIHGRGMMLRNAEVVMGIERVKKGEARLHWWKDRDGDLDVPLSGYWTLAFDRTHLFQWAADDVEEAEAA